MNAREVFWIVLLQLMTLGAVCLFINWKFEKVNIPECPPCIQVLNGQVHDAKSIKTKYMMIDLDSERIGR